MKIETIGKKRLLFPAFRSIYHGGNILGKDKFQDPIPAGGFRENQESKRKFNAWEGR